MTKGEKPLSYIIRLCQPASGSFESRTNAVAAGHAGGLCRLSPGPEPGREKSAHKAELY
jgi:hypothetical protein